MKCIYFIEMKAIFPLKCSRNGTIEEQLVPQRGASYM